MNYHNITKDDMLNGDGLRTVLWLAGCEHRCPNCQNPVTWDVNDGLVFGEAAHAELMELLSRDYISGITFSGGDPLHPLNRQGVLELCKEIKKIYPQKTIWMYTGYDWEDICGLAIMKYVNVLIDGKYIEAVRNTQLKWRGSSNQRVIDVQKSLSANTVVLYEK